MTSTKTKPGDGSKPKLRDNVVPFTRTLKFSEDDLALRFAAKYAKRLQYIDERGKWALWDGERWRLKGTSEAFKRARLVCRDAANECDNDTRSRAILRAQTVAAVERLARVDHRLLSHNDVWDADPWLLNTPDGVVDLRTGKVGDHSPEYRMTMMTAVGPRKMLTPVWSEFLRSVTGDNRELREFLQRWCGYSLTGVTREHALAFLFGPGANGKSVFIGTVSGIMGDYHVAAPMNVFIEERFERHSTELARLAGARLVTASETERGRRWAEARLKALTGGDSVTARFMRQDDFTYTPQFKLMFSGNHKPELRGVDEAIRRRLHMVLFNVTIAKEKRDPDLLEKLKEEWPGIMHWMIEGCIDWRDERLSPPKAVIDATADYLKSQDHYAQWIDEFGSYEKEAWSERTRLFESWRSWSGQNNVPAGSPSDLYGYLGSLEDVKPATRRGTRGFAGIIVRKS